MGILITLRSVQKAYLLLGSIWCFVRSSSSKWWKFCWFIECSFMLGLFSFRNRIFINIPLVWIGFVCCTLYIEASVLFPFSVIWNVSAAPSIRCIRLIFHSFCRFWNLFSIYIRPKRADVRFDNLNEFHVEHFRIFSFRNIRSKFNNATFQFCRKLICIHNWNMRKRYEKRILPLRWLI